MLNGTKSSKIESSISSGKGREYEVLVCINNVLYNKLFSLMLTLVLLLQSHPWIKHSEHPFWTSVLARPHPQPLSIPLLIDIYLASRLILSMHYSLDDHSLHCTQLPKYNSTNPRMKGNFASFLENKFWRNKKKKSLMWWVELLNICFLFFFFY